MARKFYKTSVIRYRRYRGFGFRERRAPRGIALSTSQLGSKCAPPICSDLFVIHGSLVALRTGRDWSSRRASVAQQKRSLGFPAKSRGSPAPAARAAYVAGAMCVLQRARGPTSRPGRPRDRSKAACNCFSLPPVAQNVPEFGHITTTPVKEHSLF